MRSLPVLSILLLSLGACTDDGADAPPPPAFAYPLPPDSAEAPAPGDVGQLPEAQPPRESHKAPDAAAAARGVRYQPDKLLERADGDGPAADRGPERDLTLPGDVGRAIAPP